ncbi:MAG: prepilin-type N-terminal cleavage/methylation domain-containing protein [Pseudomonadota bacterium]
MSAVTRQRQDGVTLIELLVSLAIAAILITSLVPLISTIQRSADTIDAELRLQREVLFALNRMTDAVRRTTRVMVPQVEIPTTSHIESIREESVPPGFGPQDALLVVALPFDLDANGDGVPDADNDRDGLINEDSGADLTNDGRAGVAFFDDDGNGVADGVPPGAAQVPDDDEEGSPLDEDPINGRDDDGDGMIDEDPGADMNGDGAPGVLGVDDDGDGFIDEGDVNDDDEDGRVDEDWVDPLMFYLVDDDLIERRQALTDVNGDGVISGLDFIGRPILRNVTYLGFRRTVSPEGISLITVTVESRRGEAVVRMSSTVRAEVGI